VLLTIKRQKLHSGRHCQREAAAGLFTQALEEAHPGAGSAEPYQEVLEMVMAELLADGSVLRRQPRAVLAESSTSSSRPGTRASLTLYPEKQ